MAMASPILSNLMNSKYGKKKKGATLTKVKAAMPKRVAQGIYGKH
jgi:hypothetical protein